MGVDIKNKNSVFNFLDHIYSSFFPDEQERHVAVITADFVCFIGESSIIGITIRGISVMMPAAIMDRIIFTIFSWASTESTYIMEFMVVIL